MTATAGRQDALRIAPLWLALTVALLSSLLTGGLPRTVAFGSAFNPATTAVALQPNRAQPRILVEATRLDDNPVSGASDTVTASSARAIAPFTVPRAAQTSSHQPLELPSRAVLDGSPRGPPLS